MKPPEKVRVRMITRIRWDPKTLLWDPIKWGWRVGRIVARYSDILGFKAYAVQGRFGLAEFYKPYIKPFEERGIR